MCQLWLSLKYLQVKYHFVIMKNKIIQWTGYSINNSISLLHVNSLDMNSPFLSGSSSHQMLCIILAHIPNKMNKRFYTVPLLENYYVQVYVPKHKTKEYKCTNNILHSEESTGCAASLYVGNSILKQVQEIVTFVVHFLSDCATFCSQQVSKVDSMDGRTRLLVQL